MGDGIDDASTPLLGPSGTAPAHPTFAMMGRAVHHRLPFKLKVRRVGLSISEQFVDVFQTMLDAPFLKFCLVFFICYM